MTRHTQPGDRSAALLEVVVLHPRDAAAATAGGADRLLFLRRGDGIGTTPEPAELSAMLRETDVPVRVLLREDEELHGLTAEAFRRLVETAGVLHELGADSFSFGFLDADLRVDRASCAELAAEIGLPWGFPRTFDEALEPDRAWRDVTLLPHLDAVSSAGSSRGMPAGGEELINRAGADPDVARLLLAAGGLVPEQVPWLLRAGVRQFGVGAAVRPGGSWDKAYVDAAHVRTWRMLLDDALARALGQPAD